VPKATHNRYRLQQALAYAVGLVPGMLFTALAPGGAHVRYGAFSVGLVLGLLCWAVTRGLMRRMMPSHEHRDLLILILLPYQVWTGVAALAFANRALDESPGVVHEVRVVEHERRRKGNDRIVLTHWRAGEATFEVDGYQEVGTVLNARSHPGRLGFEWIETPLSQAGTRR